MDRKLRSSENLRVSSICTSSEAGCFKTVDTSLLYILYVCTIIVYCSFYWVNQKRRSDSKFESQRLLFLLYDFKRKRNCISEAPNQVFWYFQNHLKIVLSEVTVRLLNLLKRIEWREFRIKGDDCLRMYVNWIQAFSFSSKTTKPL